MNDDVRIHYNNQLDDDEVDPRLHIKDVEFPRAVFTQSNWTGPVATQSWYGKHGPWHRIFFLGMLSSWAWTLYMFTTLVLFRGDHHHAADDLMGIPLLQANTPQEIRAMKKAHGACLESLCTELGRGVAVDCIVNNDGKTGRVEFDPDEVPATIYFPQACHDATTATFGYPYLDGDDELGTQPVAFITMQQQGNVKPKSNETLAMLENQRSLLTLLPECAIVVNAAPIVSPEELEAIRDKLQIDPQDWDRIAQEFEREDPIELSLSLDLLSLTSSYQPHGRQQQQYTPGHRERRVLRKLFCPQDMPPEVQQKVLPQLHMIYQFFMDYRTELLVLFLFVGHYCVTTVTIGWLLLRALLPAWIMKKCLKWPHRTISVWDVWRTLVLLCVASSYGLSSPVLSGVLTLGAWCYGDSTAAMEWAFLGMLAWSAEELLFPMLDSTVGAPLLEIKGVLILQYLIHALVIGEGWWKLVTIYVVTKSYQGLWLSSATAAGAAQPKNALEQTQLNLQVGGDAQAVNGAAPPAVPANGEHAKMD